MAFRLISALLIFTACFWGSCASSIAQLSATTKLLMAEYNRAKQNSGNGNDIILPEKVVEDYSLQRIEKKYIATALITVSKNINENKLMETGINVNTKTANIWSIAIPLDVVEELSAIEGVESIDIGTKINNH